MNLKQLIKKYKWNDVKDKLLQLYPEQIKSSDGYQLIFLTSQKIRIKKSKMRICIDFVETEVDGTKLIDEEQYYAVHGKDGSLIKDTDPEFYSEKIKNQEVTYAIEFSPWCEWLGMEIDQQTIDKLPELDIICHCIWEMTFCGFEEKSIQEKKEDLDRRVEEINKWSEEGTLDEHTTSWEEVKKNVEEKIKNKKEQ